jgi:hypothetical protein
MKKILVILILVVLMMALPVQSAEIKGYLRAGNALASGYDPCVLLDGNCVYDALNHDGTFVIYAPDGFHVISVRGVLKGFEEYCFVKVTNGIPDQFCTFEGNGLATPSIDVPVQTPTMVPTTSVPTQTPTITPIPTIMPTTAPVTTVPTTVPTLPPTTIPTSVPTTSPTTSPPCHIIHVPESNHTVFHPMVPGVGILVTKRFQGSVFAEEYHGKDVSKIDFYWLCRPMHITDNECDQSFVVIGKKHSWIEIVIDYPAHDEKVCSW